jgi:hypothetical protein
VFESHSSRVALRAVIAGIIALLGALAGFARDEDGLQLHEVFEALVIAIPIGVGGWMGAGYISPSEPHIGFGNPEVVEIPGEPPTVVEPGAEG